QLAVYPAGISARYERHRDAFPDDGEEYEEEESEAYSDEETPEYEGEEGSGDKIDSSGGGGGDGGGSVSFRRVTAICYLRGAGSPWKPSDGGVLRLYPPAKTAGADDDGITAQGGKVTFKSNKQDKDLGDDLVERGGGTGDMPLSAGAIGEGEGGGGGEGFIDVSPRAGRAVVFFSGAVEHEVLPVTGPLPRAAVTTWFH
ncbi:unnamed protein product, partial [Laminaria digitata]